MSDHVDKFVEEASKIVSAESVSEGEYIHVYRGDLESLDGVRILSLAPAISDPDIHDAFRHTADQWENPSSHPNVVTVHDRGTSPRPWLAVEDVDGELFEDARADLSMAEIGTIISDSAEALRNANLYNAIHSALSPDVIWVIHRDGNVVAQVDDWGLERSCRVAAGENPLSPYSAPELVDDPENTTAQTDIYGLGAIAYYALTGQPPVSVADGELAEALTEGNLTPPSQLNPSITTEVDDVILRALSRIPSERYTSAHDFRLDFVDVLPTQQEIDTSTTELGEKTRTDEQTSDVSGDRTGSDRPTSRQGQTGRSESGATDDSLQADSTQYLSRRTIIVALGFVGVGIGATELLGNSSDSEQPEIAENTPTSTPTSTVEDTPTPTIEQSNQNGNQQTSTPEETTQTPEVNTPTRDIDWFPMFRYDKSNTGHKSSAAGPTTYLSEQWRFETSRGILSSPVVAEGTVYVGTDAGMVYAIDESDGSQRWSYQTDGRVRSSPAIVDGTVYVGSDDGNLYALDAATGNEEWTFQTDRTVFSSPSVINESVYVGSDDGNIYSVDMSNGEEQWSYQTNDSVRSSPAVVDGVVFVGSNDGNFYALNTEDGTEYWMFEAGDSIRSSPVVSNSTVYVGCDDSLLYALDTTIERMADFEREEWTFQTQNRVFSSPAIANGTLYTASGQTVYGLDPSDGTEQWTFTTSGPVHSSPAVGDETVYVGCDSFSGTSEDNTIYGINTVTGTQETQFEIRQNIRSSPAVGDDTIYVGGAQINLFALTGRF